MAEILIVEDEPAINELLRRNLELVGHPVSYTHLDVYKRQDIYGRTGSTRN